MRGLKKGFGIIDILIVLSLAALIFILVVPQQIQQKKDAELKVCVLQQNKLAEAQDLYIKLFGVYADSMSHDFLVFTVLADSASLRKTYEGTFDKAERDSIFHMFDNYPIDTTQFICPTTGKTYIMRDSTGTGQEFIIECHYKEHGRVTSKD